MKPELFTWQMISLGLLILAAHTGARISRKCGLGEVVGQVLGEAGREILGIIIPGLIVFEVFGVLLAERSLLAWRALISGTTEWLDEEEKIRRGLRERRYTLAQLLKPECLRVPLPARDQGEAVYDLIQTVHAAGLIEQPGRVLGVIMERERQGGISLGEGVAILHGRLPELSQPVVALGVLPEEQSLAFGGEADKPCQIVYLVLSPEEPPELHLQVLAAVARFFDQVDARILLRHARSHSDAMEVIRKYAS
jgi:nitrogen PTS system EIIA component